MEVNEQFLAIYGHSELPDVERKQSRKRQKNRRHMLKKKCTRYLKNWTEVMDRVITESMSMTQRGN